MRRRRFAATHRLRRWVRNLALLLLLGAGIYLAANDDGVPPPILATGTERVSAHFTLCGPGRGTACVVDGDTFKLGERKIRLRGIDAPELEHAACPAELKLALKARERLRSELNRGPFWMAGQAGDEIDQYRRELRVAWRESSLGTRDNIGEAMIAAGLAHRYEGRKLPWC